MKKSMLYCLCFVLLLHFLLVLKVAAEVFCESCLQGAGGAPASS